MERSIFALTIAGFIFPGWTQVAIAQTHHPLPPVPNQRQTQTESPNSILKSILVSISATGEVYLEKEQVSSEQLTIALQKRMAENPNTQVILYGASEAMYGQVMEVLEEIQKVAGNRVSLAVLRSKQPPISITPVPPPSLPSPIFPKLTPPPSTVIPPLPPIPSPQPLPSLMR